MLKQIISRAYFIYSYFGIRSIEHRDALRETWQVFWRKHDIEARIGINVFDDPGIRRLRHIGIMLIIHKPKMWINSLKKN